MTITFHDLHKAVRTLATNEPDHKYGPNGGASVTRCSYRGESQMTPDKGRGCIFGEALKSLGVEDDMLAYYDKSVGSIDRVISYAQIEYDESSDVGWATTVQRGQDAGFSWGQALEVADYAYPHVAAKLNAHE